MSRTTATRRPHQAQHEAQPTSGVLQRACACGQHTVAGGECAECQRQRQSNPSVAVQPKLTVNAPNDTYEQEADRLADAVLRAPVSSPARPGPVGSIQRAAETGSTPVMGETAQQIAALRGGGTPLSPSARAFFEPRFGHDFGDVRVHTDARAAETAQSLSARAFTHGRDVVFGAGQYAPETDTGQRLLAHELAHVVQQGRTRRRAKMPLPILASTHPLERDAQAAAQQALSGEQVGMLLASSHPVIARQSSGSSSKQWHQLARKYANDPDKTSASVLAKKLFDRLKVGRLSDAKAALDDLRQIMPKDELSDLQTELKQRLLISDLEDATLRDIARSLNPRALAHRVKGMDKKTRGRLITDTVRGMFGIDDPAPDEVVETPPSKSPSGKKQRQHQTRAKGGRSEAESGDGPNGGDGDGPKKKRKWSVAKQRYRTKVDPESWKTRSSGKTRIPPKYRPDIPGAEEEASGKASSTKSSLVKRGSSVAQSSKSSSILEATKEKSKQLGRKADDLLRKFGWVGTVIDLGLTFGPIIYSEAEEIPKPPEVQEPKISSDDSKNEIVQKYLEQAGRIAAHTRYEMLKQVTHMQGDLPTAVAKQPVSAVLGGISTANPVATEFTHRLYSEKRFVRQQMIKHIERHVSLTDEEKETIREAINRFYDAVRTQVLGSD